MDVIQVFNDADAIAQAALSYVLNAAQESIAEKGVFNLDLAGGSTPRKLYELLAQQTDVDWQKWHFFMGDERYVPLTDERSNLHLVKESLLNKLTITAEQIHLVPVEQPTVQMCAQTYEQDIRDYFKVNDNFPPAFDLILLGMGPDGHTASLFPTKPAVHEDKKLVTASEAGLPPFVDRVTFTLPLINAGRRVLFMAAGRDKAEAFGRVRQDLKQSPAEAVTPAGKVRPMAGELHWFVDRATAGS